LAADHETGGWETQVKQVRKPRSEFWENAKGYSYPVGTALALLIVWQAGVVALDVPHYILPAPFSIVQQGIEYAPRIASHFWVTLYEALIGYGLAIVIGISLSLLIAYSSFLNQAIYPLVVFVDEVPKIALAPILITWFGFGVEPKIILTVIICFFPIFINGVAGFRSLSPQLVDLGRSTGACEWDMFWKIRLPNALPYLFVGLKMSGSGAIIGAVISEFLAGDKGLGYYLLIVLGDLRTALGFAVIAAMASVGLSLFYGMTLLESLLIPWHASKRITRRGAPPT
jgi:NitT/TauT family transport system permease protein